jgi:uncharacterized repeat protein (TIGR01451 family)
MKLDFYLFVIEWNDGVGQYNFEIDLSVCDPAWQPEPSGPCTCCIAEPEVDIGIEKTVDNFEPEIDSDIVFTITATNYGPDDATGIIVNDLLPEGLVYVSYSASQGTYDDITGDWNVGNLANGGYATLTITATVTSAGSSSEFIQLALLLDGSDSIVNSDWNIMLQGLADAIQYYCPKDGSIELTVIQFGGEDPAIAQVEIGPVIIDGTNYMDKVTEILGITKLGLKTPTACAINLAADTLRGSDYYSPDNRQVINLVTDGQPNCICEPGEHTGTFMGSGVTGTALGKASAEAARQYLLDTLEMDSDQDEFDSEAVGDAADAEWLRDYIVWPGSYDWIGDFPPGPGWVRQVADYSEFADTIYEKFAILFVSIENCATISYIDQIDSNTENDYDCIEITPQAPQID